MFESCVAALWNRWIDHQERADRERDLDLGEWSDFDGAARPSLKLAHGLRTQHLAIFGRTGSGKSSLLKHMARQDIAAGRGFVFFDLHGDATPELLAWIAEQERTTDTDLARSTVVLSPGDADHAVGLDLLWSDSELRRSVEIAGIVEILKERWNLDAFGARTEELLRNALLLLSEAGLTIIDLPLLLTSARARSTLTASSRNAAARSYFALRYDSKSEAMQGQYRDAVLNKITAFTDDPHFRHILGQVRPSFSLRAALEGQRWIFVNLPKGELGPEVSTLGSLILARLRQAVFERESRQLFTIYADEFHSLAGLGQGVDELFSESRKFGVSVVAVTQFLAQQEVRVRSALLSLGSLAFFALSPPDALDVARLLGGGQALQAELGRLDVGSFVLTRGGGIAGRVNVPVAEPSVGGCADLLARSNAQWSRRRSEIEREISTRTEALSRAGREALEGWT